MTRRQRTERILGVLSLAIGLALIAASVSVGARSSSTAGAKKFTNLRAVLDTIDYLDPAQAYTAQSAGIEYAAFDTLVTYPHKDKAHGGSKLVPGLAAAMPKISNN